MDGKLLFCCRAIKLLRTGNASAPCRIIKDASVQPKDHISAEKYLMTTEWNRVFYRIVVGGDAVGMMFLSLEGPNVIKYSLIPWPQGNMKRIKWMSQGI